MDNFRKLVVTLFFFFSSFQMSKGHECDPPLNSNHHQVLPRHLLKAYNLYITGTLEPRVSFRDTKVHLMRVVATPSTTMKCRFLMIYCLCVI